MSISKYIKVKTRVKGFHSWPEAPDEVSFLRSPHRHEFVITVVYQIDEDREREFFIEQSALEDYLYSTFESTNYGFLINLSCEALAVKILETLGAVQVEVSEDGENSSIARRIIE